MSGLLMIEEGFLFPYVAFMSLPLLFFFPFLLFLLLFSLHSFHVSSLLGITKEVGSLH
jgi:hypothetical protein